MPENTINLPQWYAIYTRSRAEKKVLEQLTLRGIEAYLPLQRVMSQWSDRKKLVEKPVINSYVFVRIVPEERPAVFDVQGFVAFVSDRGRPAVIPTRQIENMRRTVDSNVGFDVVEGVFEVGETVRILEGPLAGIEGQISEVKGAKKLHMIIAQLGFTLVIDIKSDRFEKVK